MADLNNDDYESTTIKKFNRLRAQYNNEYLEKNIFFSEESVKEEEIKNTMSNFNNLIKTKFVEIRKIKENVSQLDDYKKEIIDILNGIKKMEDKYIEIYQKNTLNANELKLEKPIYNFGKEILNGQMRPPPDIDISFDILNITNHIFTIKNEYVNSMRDICYKIDEKVDNEMIRMGIINDFIDVYKKTLSSFDLDKKILSKYTCTICYENEVKMCINPCGHTFCKQCSEKIISKCFACNCVVKEKTRLFLSGNTDTMNDEENPIITGDFEPYTVNLGQMFGV